MSATTKDITAEQWLDIRDHVARTVKSGATSGTRNETTVAIAEKLLRSGLVDIDAVLVAIAPAPPKPTPTQAPKPSTVAREGF